MFHTILVVTTFTGLPHVFYRSAYLFLVTGLDRRQKGSRRLLGGLDFLTEIVGVLPNLRFSIRFTFARSLREEVFDQLTHSGQSLGMR